MPRGSSGEAASPIPIAKGLTATLQRLFPGDKRSFYVLRDAAGYHAGHVEVRDGAVSACTGVADSEVAALVRALGVRPGVLASALERATRIAATRAADDDEI